MKKYLSIMSSIITILVYIIGQFIIHKLEYNAQITYNVMASILVKILMFLVLGIIIGWNICVLTKRNEKSIIIIVSIILNFFVVLVYFYGVKQIFLQPIVLIGIYVFILIRKKYYQNKIGD